MITNGQSVTRPSVPRGLNHLVLRAKNIDESHVFWTEYLGFTHVATTYSSKGDSPPKETRYFSGLRDGRVSHHDVALVESSRVAIGDDEPIEIDHVAIEYASEEAWRHQIDFLSSRDIRVRGCIRRGTTMSARVTDPNGYTVELVSELPRELWEADINAALNKSPIPVEGFTASDEDEESAPSRK